MMTNETLLTLNNYLTWIDQIQGLPAAALVCFSAIAVGYVLRCIKRFPNEGIPVVVILWAAVAMLFIADPRASTMPMRIWGARNLFVGLALGVIAWIAHKTVLSKLEKFILGGSFTNNDSDPKKPTNPPTSNLNDNNNADTKDKH
jgi:hypothetical protein